MLSILRFDFYKKMADGVLYPLKIIHNCLGERPKRSRFTDCNLECLFFMVKSFCILLFQSCFSFRTLCIVMYVFTTKVRRLHNYTYRVCYLSHHSLVFGCGYTKL